MLDGGPEVSGATHGSGGGGPSHPDSPEGEDKGRRSMDEAGGWGWGVAMGGDGVWPWVEMGCGHGWRWGVAMGGDGVWPWGVVMGGDGVWPWVEMGCGHG